MAIFRDELAHTALHVEYIYKLYELHIQLGKCYIAYPHPKLQWK